jgi:tetratricopeptide (TPR) repeat protein
VFKSPIVRIGSLLAAIALAIVFIPTDLTFNAIGSKQVQEKYRKEALEDIEKQKDELTKVLESTPNDPELLKQQAKNFLALDDYPSALPLMEKLVSLEDTEANSMAIAEVWNLDGQPERALSVLKDYADKHLSDSSGPPSASFLKALTDSLSKNNRQGVALAYVDAFVKKNPGDIDDVDAELLKARVYSGWKGKGKEAEKAFSDVVEKHPEDFRGYLARGVFMREIGRPDEATSMFKQAEALAPAGDTKAVVKDVISRANKEKSGSVQL